MGADELYHEGIDHIVARTRPGKVGSGRHPWGSGENPGQHQTDYLRQSVERLKKQGLSEKERAFALGFTSINYRKPGKPLEGDVDKLRAHISMEKDEALLRFIEKAQWLTSPDGENLSVNAAAKKLGVNESVVRARLKPGFYERHTLTTQVAEELKNNVNKDNFLQVGAGTQYGIGDEVSKRIGMIFKLSPARLNNALTMLEEQGYKIYNVPLTQQGTGYKMQIKVLCPPGVTWAEAANNKDKIHAIDEVTVNTDGSRSLGTINTEGVSSKRVTVRYAEDGGSDRDGLIELRRGVPDLSLGSAHYAQVRIAVDGTHFLKGMAVYSDDLPPGIDIRFNTSKTKDKPMMGPDDDHTVLKLFKKNKDNPFGASIKEENKLILVHKKYIDPETGEEKLSPINVVNEEGNWNTWSRRLPTQFIGKQPIPTIRERLSETYKENKKDFDEICALTNPEVKKKLLEEFAEDCDSKAVHLKAKGYAGQEAKVLLPVPSLKDNEVYCPTFKNGEEVILIRYPHAATFEIVRAKVNNKNKEGVSLLGKAIDGIGVNPHQLQQLSGADTDGDSVTVIPTKSIPTKIKTNPYPEEMKNFDPHKYKLPAGVEPISDKYKQTLMGKDTNLLMDMTTLGAPEDQIIRAAKHQMVTIDAHKHSLDYKASIKENGIDKLREEWQGSTQGGASTLFSRAKSPEYVEKRKPYYLSKNTINPETGEKIFQYTGDVRKNKKTWEPMLDSEGNPLPKLQKSTKMFETSDARTLYSDPNNPNPKEVLYADYANKMKALANAARKEWLKTPSSKKDPSAAKIYAPEVEDLMRQLMIAEKNSPREAKAQAAAGEIIRNIKRENPDLENDEIKKYRNQALAAQRVKYNARKQRIDISERQWEAIQAHAISPTTLRKILNNTDADKIRRYATPRNDNKLTSSDIAQIKALLNSSTPSNPVTKQELADKFDVSISTISRVIASSGY